MLSIGVDEDVTDEPAQAVRAIRAPARMKGLMRDTTGLGHAADASETFIHLTGIGQSVDFTARPGYAESTHAQDAIHRPREGRAAPGGAAR